MSIDLNGLSAKELDSLIAQAKKRRTTLHKRKPIAEVRKKLTALARAEGYTVAELFSGAASAPAKKGTAAKPARKSTKGYKLGKVAPKYRNPQNPSETWAGRGQQPKWMATQIAAGKKVDDFLIR
ncbi:H-NS histone family protein [Lysobacter sp. KIS68-7]|uniref:H-NS histone family protein n=1 Tax=Lysobacter sp. KIS68-7 TaxID=2904252 RepID=UPI001E292EE6|nr:H-NS histone family protein [Lysobacter sp. KIS68-7]UHQ19984.1 H-NS histone family protein [Lysobacter sp. KIS68-7]